MERHGRGQTDVVTYDALHSGRRAKDVVRWQLALQTNSECSGGAPTGRSRFTSSRGMRASCVEDGFVGGDGAGDRLDAGTRSTARSRRASASSIQHPDISICQRRNMPEVLRAATVEMLGRPATFGRSRAWIRLARRSSVRSCVLTTPMYVAEQRAYRRQRIQAR